MTLQTHINVNDMTAHQTQGNAHRIGSGLLIAAAPLSTRMQSAPQWCKSSLSSFCLEQRDPA